MIEELDSEVIHQFTPEGVINGRKLPTAYERPCEMPILGEGEVLVAVFDSGMGVRISYFRVDDLSGMQEVWDKYAQGYALEPPKFIIVKESEVTALKPNKDMKLDPGESRRLLLMSMLEADPSVANVVQLLESSWSLQEFNENCDYIKGIFGGKYPDFWFVEIMSSGIFATISKKCGR